MQTFVKATQVCRVCRVRRVRRVRRVCCDLPGVQSTVDPVDATVGEEKESEDGHDQERQAVLLDLTCRIAPHHVKRKAN